MNTLRVVKRNIYTSLKSASYSLNHLPRNLQELSYACSGYPIIANGMPKAGTNLLISVMEALNFVRYGKFIEFYNWPVDEHQDSLAFTTQRLVSLGDNNFSKRRYIRGHFFYNERIKDILQKHNFKMVLILRDPRDVIISHIFHVEKRTRSKFHEYYEKIPSMKEKIEVSITGVSKDQQDLPYYWLPNIKERLETFTPWAQEPFCHVCKFEDLVGPNGGGEQSSQMATLRGICDHLEYPLSDERLVQVAKNCFSIRSPTFRKGQIGSWREFFDDELLDLFHSYAKDLMNQLGYIDVPQRISLANG